MLPGLVLAATGLCIFGFVETDENYPYTHSVWHIVMAGCVVFLLPINRQKKLTLSGKQCYDGAHTHTHIYIFIYLFLVILIVYVELSINYVVPTHTTSFIVITCFAVFLIMLDCFRDCVYTLLYYYIS